MSEELFSIIDDVTPAKPIPPVIGRSEMEPWSNCPQQAAQIQGGHVSVGNELMAVGDEVHHIFSAACKARRVEGMRYGDLIDLMTDMAAKCLRTDVQPQVVEVIRYGQHGFAKILTQDPETGQERSADDVWRFDGGEDMTAMGGPNMAGQISQDLVLNDEDYDLMTAWHARKTGRVDPNLPKAIRATGEMDVAMPTHSPEVIAIIDTKAGYADWTATKVEQSYQLGCFYPYIAFANFPAIQRIAMRVFMPRRNELTPVVFFAREQMYAMEQRIRTTLRNMLRFDGLPLEQVPAWPTFSKCGLCDAAIVCPHAFKPLCDDKRVVLQQYMVMSASLKRHAAVLNCEVKRVKSDLVYDINGEIWAWGKNWPRKTSNAPTPKVYRPGVDPANESDE